MAKSNQMSDQTSDQTWNVEVAYRESVAREWVAQRLVWERRLRSVSETAAAHRSTEVALKKAS
jgi:hypothetical protein